MLDLYHVVRKGISDNRKISSPHLPPSSSTYSSGTAGAFDPVYFNLSSNMAAVIGGEATLDGFGSTVAGDEDDASLETAFPVSASSSFSSHLFLDKLQIPRDLWNLTAQLFNDEILFNSSTHVQDGYVHDVYTFHPKAQCCLLLLIMLTTLFVNMCIVGNVQRNEIKRRMANFALISHLCTVDMLGALFVTPLPFWATWQGFWVHNEFVCMSSCVAIVAMWLQHILVFSLLKIDQVFAGWLPVGSYPAISADVATFVVLGIWAISFGSSGLVVSVYGSIFEPAVMLCIPNLPPSFFITVFVIYCLIISSMVLGYLVVACVVRHHRSKNEPGTDVKLGELHRLESATVTSFINTFVHFLMYIPAMLVVGLHGFGLPPEAILACDFVVYSEFLVHPTMLLIGSTKMRQEIFHSIKKRLCCRRFATTPPHCVASRSRVNRGLSRFQWILRARGSRCRPSLNVNDHSVTPLPEAV